MHSSSIFLAFWSSCNLWKNVLLFIKGSYSVFPLKTPSCPLYSNSYWRAYPEIEHTVEIGLSLKRLDLESSRLLKMHFKRIIIPKEIKKPQICWRCCICHHHISWKLLYLCWPKNNSWSISQFKYIWHPFHFLCSQLLPDNQTCGRSKIGVVQYLMYGHPRDLQLTFLNCLLPCRGTYSGY